MRDRRYFWLGAAFGACLLLLAQPLMAAAGEARIANASSARNGHVLSVAFTLADAFAPKMEEAIMSGIAQTFAFQFEVYRVVRAWPDMRIYNWTVKRTIRYDTLKKIFTVEAGEDVKPKQTADFVQAKKWMTEFVDFPVAVSPALEAGSQYYVRVKAAPDAVDLPFYLNRLFASSWNFDTPWQRIDLPAKAPSEPTAPTP